MATPEEKTKQAAAGATPPTSKTADKSAAATPPDPLGPPSATFLKDFTYVASSDAIATRDEVARVFEKFTAFGVPAGAQFPAALQLALACSDAHASSLTVLVGECTSAPGVSLRDLAAAVKTTCTLRQFCRFYAKFVWNFRVANDLPPGSWAAAGFPFEARFAAFDFFDGVTHPAALEPANGLIRPPTALEQQAYQTGKFVALATSGHQTLLSNHAGVTHGKIEASHLPALLPP